MQTTTVLMYVGIRKKKNKKNGVDDGKSNLKITDDVSDVSYQFVAGDEAGQPGYFVTKSGHDFTVKEFLAAEELMQDIKKYSLESGLSVEELI
jgi:hypothetical protein